MEYTKDNIAGIVFLGPDDPYVIYRVEENNVIMGYHSTHPSYSSREFDNTLSVTLDYLNNGTWKVVFIPMIHPEPYYQIY
jgi:hypothetical protein